MNLEFGVFDHLDRNDLALYDLYEQRLKAIELFDRFGFYATAFAAGTLFNLANLVVVGFLVARQAREPRLPAILPA